MRRDSPSRRGARRVAVGLVLALLGCGGKQADVKQRRDQADYHYRLAYGHYFDKLNPSGDAAMQEVLLSLELDPEHVDAHFLAGLIFMGRSRHLDAVEHFQRAVALRPDFYDAKNNLGATYLAMERWDDAILVFRDLVVAYKNRTPGNAHNNLAWAYYKRGDADEAETHYRQAMSLAPDLCPPYNNLAMLLFDRGELEHAQKYLDRGLRRCPTYPELYYHLGRIAARQAQLADARDRFTRCVELSGDSPLGERCQSHLSALGAAEVTP